MKRDNRVVTRYTGSGIKGLKRAGIRDLSQRSGVTLRGTGTSIVFLMESGIRLTTKTGQGSKFSSFLESEIDILVKIWDQGRENIPHHDTEY